MLTGTSASRADIANGVDTVFISRNDRLYRPASARDVNSSLYAAYQPYFVCSVRARGGGGPCWGGALVLYIA